ncbi:MAG TPA: hypothetical protein VFV66_20850 [Nonomuraea sp.]|nr:hypothetical protein [Nonomuraea sp.]
MTTPSKVRRAVSSVALAVAALVAVLLPAAPAHAAWGPDQTVFINVISNDGYGRQLARLEGTIAFDDGNAMFRYSLQLCWGSGAYPAPSVRFYVNGTTFYGPVGAGETTATGCQRVFLYASQTNVGGLVSNVRIDVTAGWFYPGNQYNTRTKSATYDNPFN